MEENNIHSIISLPAGVFLPYSGVKTNIIFFDKTKSTEQIRYYEVAPERKLTKNKPINYDDLTDMVTSFRTKTTGDHSWVIPVSQIRDYDISAKNPANIKEVTHKSPSDILATIQSTNQEITTLTEKLSQLISK